MFKKIFFVLITFCIFFQCKRKNLLLDVQYDQWYILKNERGSLYFKPHLKLPTNEIEGKFFQDNGNFYQQTSIAYLTSNGLFDKEKRPIIKGNVTTEKNKIIVTSNEQTLEFHLLEQEKDLPHYFPFYDSFLTREQINQVTVQYGSAKGFYSSKVYNHISSENYGDIILDILDELRKNLATPQTLNLEMDIYYPRIPLKYKLPVLFLFHGGAFVIGDKQDRLQKELANYFAARGYVVVSVNYRLGYVAIPGLYSNLERAMYKAVQDARAAMRWMAKHANKYGIDPHMFFLAGNSAGGFISLMTAFMKEDEVFPSTRGSTFLLQPDLGCLDCSGNDFKVNYSIRGVVNLWGGLLDLNLIDRDEKIPLLLIHGENDQIVPADYNYPFQNVSPEAGSLLSASIYGSKRIFEHARKLNLPVSLYLIPNEGHEPQLDSTFQLTHWLDSIQTKMREFLYGIIVKSLSPLKIWTWDELPHRFRIKTNHSIKLYRVYPENILFTEEDSTYRLIVLDSQPDLIELNFLIEDNSLIIRRIFRKKSLSPV